MPFSPQILITLLAFASCAVADPTDWVNIDYACKKPRSSSTMDAQNAIIQGARSSAAKGPWSVTNSKGVNPPSGDSHDYLSWAPYHWPDCNWCAGRNGHVHLVHDGNRTDDSGSTSDNGDDVYQDEAVQSPDEMSEFPVARHRMSRRRRRADDVIEPSEDLPSPQAPLGALPSTASLSSLYLSTSPTKTTATAVAGTSAPPQAAAKTSSCTPSPTKPMPASATWTTCPYVVKDGKVNPDVRTLNGPAAINSASQSILYNAVCFALTGTSTCSKNAVNFIRAFFLNALTGMSPNMNFGQVVRGPETGQEGTFTGMLDLRGFAKVVNAICILKAAESPDWTNATDQDMYEWTNKYVSWLTNSDLGKSTASKANNHCTFYYVQKVAAKIFLGDKAGAISDLEAFFRGPFLDQIAADGEQPLEAVRTRPWHYRCFNMEALITLCKLGDYLGRDFWTAESRYRATIQTALDFLIQLDPKGEDVTEVGSHVAAVAAAYGDRDGKYAAFTKKAMGDCRTQPFYYYNQPEAFTQAPSVQRHKREDSRDTAVADTIPFQCPIQEIINGEKVVVLDNGVCVTCDKLRPLYMNKTLADNIPV